MKARLPRLCFPFILPPSSFILNFLRSAPRLRDVDDGRVAEAARELICNRAAELRERGAADEVDGRAAEAAARHARPGDSPDARGDLDQRVKLRAAHLVVV